MNNPHALAILKVANRILPLTHLHATEQRRPAIDIIGDLYAVAEDIDKAAPVQAPAAPLAASNDTLAKLGAGVALALAEMESAYQRTESLSERHRLTPLISTLRDGLNAYRAEVPPVVANSRRVVVTLETGDGARIETVARRHTIAQAEAFLNGPGIDAKALHEGRYTIAAPHGLGNDAEAVPLARKLGYQGADDPAAAFAFLSTRNP